MSRKSKKELSESAYTLAKYATQHGPIPDGEILDWFGVKGRTLQPYMESFGVDDFTHIPFQGWAILHCCTPEQIQKKASYVAGTAKAAGRKVSDLAEHVAILHQNGFLDDKEARRISAVIVSVEKSLRVEGQAARKALGGSKSPLLLEE